VTSVSTAWPCAGRHRHRSRALGGAGRLDLRASSLPPLHLFPRGLAGRPPGRVRRPGRGQRRAVSGQSARRSDRLIIEGPAGRIEAPPETAPSEPSLENAIRRDWFFDSKTGELLRATVTEAGQEPLDLGQKVVTSTRYEVSGELELHVWFDGSGAWVQWRLWRQGAAITLVRD
jgi:hypothetical protein